MCGARMPRDDVPEEVLFPSEFGYTSPEISMADVDDESDGIEVRGS